MKTQRQRGDVAQGRFYEGILLVKYSIIVLILVQLGI